jgi:hypothetical protein
MDNEVKKEIEELKRQNSELAQKSAELTKKVDALYSTAGFPDTILETLQRNGFVRIDQVLETPFTTLDGYDSKYYYCFAKLDNKNVVFSNIAAKDFTKIQSVSVSGDTFTSNNHGLLTNDIVTFWTTTTPPAPLLNGGTYYVHTPTTNTFKLSATSSGSAINITTVGTGTHFLQRINIIF